MTYLEEIKVEAKSILMGHPMSIFSNFTAYCYIVFQSDYYNLHSP